MSKEEASEESSEELGTINIQGLKYLFERFITSRKRKHFRQLALALEILIKD